MIQSNSIPPIVYPDSDGEPIADNTKQARWITTLYANLAAQFTSHNDVFVAMDLLWYPEEGHPEIRIAPDVLVVFGRPPGDRGSYKQWEENGVPLTVVFEILSPGNEQKAMEEKRLFYEDRGVEEYYVYDPDTNRLAVFLRRGEVFRRIRQVTNWESPRLGIRFDFSEPEMVVYGPGGKRFVTLAEEQQAREQAEKQRDLAQKQAQDAETQKSLALKQAQDVSDRFVRLRELSRKARHNLASVEELAELDRLEQGNDNG